jgi:Flp pilus assembly protein TadB
MYDPATASAEDKQFVLDALRELISSDLRDQFIRQLKKDACEEAKRYKKSLFKKVRTSIIIETILVAFLVGLIVNQVTSLLTGYAVSATIIIVVSLLLCILLIWLETGKD